MFSHRYSAGLDDAATVELLSSTGGSASALAAYEAKKGAREHEGNKINSALQKLEKVRFRLFERLSDSDEPACKKETYARRRWINVETTRLKVVQAIRDFSQESGSVTLSVDTNLSIVQAAPTNFCSSCGRGQPQRSNYEDETSTAKNEIARREINQPLTKRRLAQNERPRMKNTEKRRKKLHATKNETPTKR